MFRKIPKLEERREILQLIELKAIDNHGNRPEYRLVHTAAGLEVWYNGKLLGEDPAYAGLFRFVWYRVSTDGTLFVEVDDGSAKAATYSTTLDDVGFRICVKVIDCRDETNFNMKTVAPVEMDPRVKDAVELTGSDEMQDTLMSLQVLCRSLATAAKNPASSRKASSTSFLTSVKGISLQNLQTNATNIATALKQKVSTGLNV
jgi:hypothetical protein